MTPDTSTERFAGHTPGPWKAYQGPKDITPFVASSVGDKETICECYTYGLGAHVYNAELIAAAPALLAERDALAVRVTALEAALVDLRQRWLAEMPPEAAVWESSAYTAEREALHRANAALAGKGEGV